MSKFFWIEDRVIGWITLRAYHISRIQQNLARLKPSSFQNCLQTHRIVDAAAQRPNRDTIMHRHNKVELKFVCLVNTVKHFTLVRTNSCRWEHQFQFGIFANPIFSGEGGYPQIVIDSIGYKISNGDQRQDCTSNEFLNLKNIFNRP
jgi:hypothetical protein